MCLDSRIRPDAIADIRRQSEQVCRSSEVPDYEQAKTTEVPTRVSERQDGRRSIQ